MLSLMFRRTSASDDFSGLQLAASDPAVCRRVEPPCLTECKEMQVKEESGRVVRGGKVAGRKKLPGWMCSRDGLLLALLGSGWGEIGKGIAWVKVLVRYWDSRHFLLRLFPNILAAT